MYTNECAIVHLQRGDDHMLFKGKFRCNLDPGLKELSTGRDLGWRLFPRLSSLGVNSGEIRGAPRCHPLLTFEFI